VIFSLVVAHHCNIYTSDIQFSSSTPLIFIVIKVFFCKNDVHNIMLDIKLANVLPTFGMNLMKTEILVGSDVGSYMDE
jgi:hypothetical protein